MPEFDIPPLASVFPIRSRSPITFVDTWGAPRGDGTRSHEGTDIFAPRGAEVVAVADGVAKSEPGQLSGLAVALYPPDGSKFVFAHLDGYAGSFPREVRAGDVIGYVGTTGNAVGTDPHLHFEFHPRAGGPAINPVPLLERLRSPSEAAALEQVPKEARDYSNPPSVKVKPANGAMLFALLYLLSKGRR